MEGKDKKDSPVEKVVIDEEEQDDIEIDGILNFYLEQCLSIKNVGILK